MNEKLLNYQLELVTLSPVHIGISDKYAKPDYVFDPQTKQVGILDQNKWMQWLQQKNLLDSYIEMLARSGSRMDNYRWLQQTLNQNPIDACSNLFLTVLTAYQADYTLNEISKQLRDVYARPYIPGSSIKGVIRTAVLSSLIKRTYEENRKEAAQLNQLWRKLKQDVTQSGIRKPFLNKIVRSSEKQIMDLLCRPAYDRKGKPLTPQLSDPFRAIRVSDSSPFQTDATILVKKNDIVVTMERKDVAELSLWRECIQPRQKVTFSLTLDLDFLKQVGLEFIDDSDAILSCLNIHRSMVLESHEKLLTNAIVQTGGAGAFEYRVTNRPKDYQVLTLGGGTGFQNKSLIYALAPTTAEANKLVETILEIQFQGKHRGKDTIASPRTIKTAKLYPQQGVKQAGRYKMGLCAIREVCNATQS